MANSQPEKKAGDEAAHMRGHADLRCESVEDGLDNNDGDDVLETGAGARQMTISEEEPGPGADDPHDAARGSDELRVVNETNRSEENNARARTKSRDKIAKQKPGTADSAFQRRTENVKGKEVKEKMQRAEMEKESGDHPPVLVTPDDEERIERTESAESDWIRRTGALNGEDDAINDD